MQAKTPPETGGAEFAKFDSILTNIQKRLNTTNSDLDELIGKRSRAISRKLRDVEVATISGEEIFGIGEGESSDVDED